MTNKIIDTWIGPKVMSINECWVENIFSNSTKEEYKDGFRESYRKYLAELGIKNTNDFKIIEKVAPKLLYNFLYDFKNKKVLKLFSFRNNITESSFKELLDKHNNDNKHWYDIYDILNDFNVFEGDSFDVDFELLEELSKYSYLDFSRYDKVLMEYDFDTTLFNEDDLLEPDYPFTRQHIGIGTKYRQFDKDKNIYNILNDGVLVNKDDNGEECIYIFLELNKKQK